MGGTDIMDPRIVEIIPKYLEKIIYGGGRILKYVLSNILLFFIKLKMNKVLKNGLPLLLMLLCASCVSKHTDTTTALAAADTAHTTAKRLSSLFASVMGSCHNGEQSVINETGAEKADTSRSVVLFTNDSCMKMILCSNYEEIDSITDSNISFDATYHHCGKGDFVFSKKDLIRIKNADLREKISYYYSEWGCEENHIPVEPTAVLLLQGGKELYLNTLESVENACGLPINTPVTCKAYSIEVFTKTGVFNELVIYDMKIRNDINIHITSQ